MARSTPREQNHGSDEPRKATQAKLHKKTNQLLIVLHGLEGNGNRHYVLGSAKIANQNNMDAVCVNFRGCSGEVNKSFQSYHSGKTDDLSEVIKHLTTHYHYDTIYLNGFSLGGNVILKYLGEIMTKRER